MPSPCSAPAPARPRSASRSGLITPGRSGPSAPAWRAPRSPSSLPPPGPALALSEIAERLDHGLDLLSKGGRDRGERQGSLRAAITWSHDLLNGTEQRLFRRLSVFSGGFTLEAVEGVCAGDVPAGPGVPVGCDMPAGPDPIETLAGLVDKSLVVLGEERAGAGRYRLLETIRSYAAERLQRAGEGPELADRHAAYYARLAHEHAREGGAVNALDRLEADHPNLLAALEHLASTGDAVSHGRLATDLWSFWNIRGHYRVGRQEMLRFLERPGGEPASRVACARYVGNFANYLGELAEARRWHDEALRLARESGDRRAEGTCLRNCGNDSFRECNFTEARARFSDALAMTRELGDRTMEGRCAGSVGVADGGLGDARGAWSWYTEGVKIAEAVGDRLFLSVWLGNRAAVALALGRYTNAGRTRRRRCAWRTK